MGRALSGQPFNHSLVFPTIDIKEKGTYKISYYVLLFCNENGCMEAGDSINVSIGSDQIFTYDYSSIEMQRKWIKQTHLLNLDQGELKVSF